MFINEMNGYEEDSDLETVEVEIISVASSDNEQDEVSLSEFQDDYQQDPNYQVDDANSTDSDVSQANDVDEWVYWNEDGDRLLCINYGSSIFACALNQTIFFLGGENNNAALYQISPFEKIIDCTGHCESVVAGGLNRDSKYLATGDMNGDVFVWNIEMGKVHCQFQTGSELHYLFWHPVGNLLFGGCDSGEIYIWEIKQQQQHCNNGNVRVLASTDATSTNCACLLSDNKQLVSGYESGMVIVWDLKNSNVKHKINLSIPVICMDVNQELNIICCGLKETHGTILKHDMTLLNHLNIPPPPHNSSFSSINNTSVVENCKFGKGPSAQLLATVEHHTIRIWDVKNFNSPRHLIELFYPQHSMENGATTSAEEGQQETTTIEYAEIISRLEWNHLTGALYACGAQRGTLFALENLYGNVTVGGDNRTKTEEEEKGKPILKRINLFDTFKRKSGKFTNSRTMMNDDEGMTGGILDMCLSNDKLLLATNNGLAYLLDTNYLDEEQSIIN